MADVKVKATATVTLSIYRDTESVTRYYKLQTSSLAAPLKPTTNPPSSDWVKVEPACDITKTLYFCDISVFSNGTWFPSEVSKSSSYEAAKEAYNKAQSAQDGIDNLEVGGRNYITKISDRNVTLNGITVEVSDNIVHIHGTNTKTDNAYSIGDFAIRDNIFDPETNYTISTTAPLPSGLYLGVNSRTASGTSCSAGSASYLYGDGNKESLTFTTRSDINGLLNGFFGVLKTCGTVDVTFKIKLEKGNKATDWTPAPDDVEEEIGDIGDSVIRLESSIEKTAGAIVIEALSDYVRYDDVENEDGTVTGGFNSVVEALRAAITAADGRVTTEVANRTEANDGIQQQITEIRNRMDFDESGLIFRSFVDGVESPYRIKITNDEMIFYNGKTEVQRFDAQGNAKIPSLVVDNSMRLGGFALTTDSSGNLNLDWIGGN